MRDLLFFITEDVSVWGRINKISNQKLQPLVQSLPNVIMSAHAKSTVSKYKSAWRKWTDWVNTYDELNLLPPDPVTVALYFTYIVEEQKKLGYLTAAYCGIKWGYSLLGVSSPTDNKFVKLAYEGAHRLIAQRQGPANNRKEHLTPEILKEIIYEFGTTGNLLDLRFALVCILGFFGFFRISELLIVQIKDITFCDEGVDIFIDHSKVDQKRKGETVPIAKSNSPYCPVLWLKKYLRSADLFQKKEAFLVCRLFKTKNGHIVKSGKNISYTTIRKEFLTKMSKIVKNPTIFGTHSMRSGGATCASESGVPDRLISKHGRWSSNTSRDKYIRDSSKTKFSVTKRMKLI